MVSGPTVIRVSPSLLYTLSMTTNTILLEQSHYATRRSPNDRKNDKQPLGAYVIHNKSLIDLVIGQVSCMCMSSLLSLNWSLDMYCGAIIIMSPNAILAA